MRPIVVMYLIAGVGLSGALAHGQEEPVTDPVLRTIRVQAAMESARSHLHQNRTLDAIQTLERELPNIEGNTRYLTLLREAYHAHLKGLILSNGSEAEIARFRERLGALGEEAVPQPPAPPPDPAPTEMPSPEPVEPTTIAPADDPFQQTPLDDLQPPVDSAQLAVEAFGEGRYGTAHGLFSKAVTEGHPFTASEHEAWAYARLSLIVEQINRASTDPCDWDALVRAVDEAEALTQQASPLRAYADHLRQQIEQRRPKATREGPVIRASDDELVEGWRSVATANFRILYRDRADLAEQAARIAEVNRASLFQKWGTPATAAWAPRCDLYLHASAELFAEATGKAVTLPGNAQVRQQGNRIVTRRIDLRLDHTDWLTATLPYEIAHLVVVDLFIDQPPPRWASEAIAVLAQPSNQVERYLAAVGRCRQHGPWLALRELLPTTGYPKAEWITPFYAESVSLVHFLIQQRDEKTFALFLREAPRYGYEQSLERQYGFASFEDLERQWLAQTLLSEN